MAWRIRGLLGSCLLPCILPCYFIVFATALSCLYISLPLWACWLVFLLYHPIDPLILSFGFLGPFITSFPLIIFYGLVGHHSCYVSLLSLPLYSLGFLSPFTSSLPLFTPMGFLLDSLGFLSPFTICLPIYYSYRLIDPYFCHVNPTKFTTLFFRLPLPVYFLFPSRYSYGLATLFLGLLQPIYFFSPFTSSLSLVTFMGLLAINPATSTH